jgi:hypothetical protein
LGLPQQFLRPGKQFVLDQDLIPGRHDSRDRREVALAAGGQIADQRPDRAEGSTEDGSRDDRREVVAVLAEEGEDQADKKTQPQA